MFTVASSDDSSVLATNSLLHSLQFQIFPTLRNTQFSLGVPNTLLKVSMALSQP